MRNIMTLAVAIAIAAFANPANAASPTGTWKSTVNFNNQAIENVVRLSLDSEGPTLSGYYSDGLSNREAPIAEAGYKGKRVSFSVVRDLGGDSFTINYSGTLNGDTITGKCHIDHGNQTQSTDWIARRLK